MNEKTIWNESIEKVNFPPLYGEVNTDVLVVGAGITGLTAAYLLASEGKNVTVVEAESIDNSATARSSAHLTTESDFSYEALKSKYSLETCIAVANSRKFAISFIENLSKKFECDFKYVSGYLYSEEEKDLQYLHKEKDVASQSGLDVYSASAFKLPFRVAGAIEYKNQAIFNPAKYLYGIATHLYDTSNCKIYENSRVIGKDDHAVYTQYGSIRAKSVIYATHYPIFFDCIPNHNTV